MKLSAEEKLMYQVIHRRQICRGKGLGQARPVQPGQGIADHPPAVREKPGRMIRFTGVSQANMNRK